MLSHKIVKVLSKLRIRIRMNRCKIDSINFPKIILKSQRKIRTAITLPPHPILKIQNFLPLTNPPNLIPMIIPFRKSK